MYEKYIDIISSGIILARDLTRFFIASLLSEKFKCSSLSPREDKEREKFLSQSDIPTRITSNMNTFVIQNFQYKDIMNLHPLLFALIIKC